MKRLIYIPIFLAFLAGAISCEREDLLQDEDRVERTDNLPIQLEVSIGDALSTRSVENAKKEFSFGDIETGESPDVIHVQSTFQLEGGGSITRYCAMQYTEGGKWVPMGNASFAWPNTAVSGKFTAYYIYGSNGMLTGNESDSNSSTLVAFTDIVDGQDPLRADTENVPYGHTVGLNFIHILTHLTLIELDAGIDNELIFHISPDDARDINKHQFMNGFKISLDKGTDGQGEPEIKFEYINIDSQNLNGKVSGYMIKAPTTLVRDKETREESRQVGFFLEPGCCYNAFSVYFSNGDQYISYKNSSTDPDKRLPLDENNRYIFNVKKSAGVTIQTPPEQRWDESEDETVVVDVEAFLHAINTNSPYSELDENGEEVQILEQTTNPVGTLLLCNVRFKNPYYHIFPHHNPEPDADGNTPQPYDFVPSVGSDNVFDGGYHYIKGLCCPLFFSNNGVIKNLGLSDVNIGGDEYGMWESSKNFYNDTNDDKAYVNAPYEYHRTGVITTNNFGTVQNIRVKDLTMNVGIRVTEGDQEAHSVGALFGVNQSSGLVEKIYLSGKIEVTVQNYSNGSYTEDQVPEVNIGGLAGQNLGTMTNIEQLVDNRTDVEISVSDVAISVINKLDGGSGAYYIGGFVGTNTGKLSEVSIPTIPTAANDNAVAVTIDSSKSFGVLSDIGGIVGKAGSSQGNEISSCLIGSGLVTAGNTTKYQAISPFSYTGGIVGVLSERTHVFNCTSFCSVAGFGGNDGVTCAAGGAFGNIMAIQQSEGSSIQPGTMTAIAAFGDSLTGKNAGCFVGEAPYGKTWDDYKDSADVKEFPGIGYIGSNTDAAPQP